MFLYCGVWLYSPVPAEHSATDECMELECIWSTLTLAHFNPGALARSLQHHPCPFCGCAPIMVWFYGLELDRPHWLCLTEGTDV